MKRMTLALGIALAASVVSAQGMSRKVYKPGETTSPSEKRVTKDEYDRTKSIGHSDYDRTPGGDHIDLTPIALTLGPVGMPYGRNWGITGLRINLGFPGFTQSYEAVYGVDVGLSGETHGEAGGVLVNALNNEGRDMYGLAVAGLWNNARGTDSVALQLAAGYNAAEGLAGVQIGLVNRAHELHGVQLGIYNASVNGTGLQIGLWNDSGNGTGSPLIGIIY